MSLMTGQEPAPAFIAAPVPLLLFVRSATDGDALEGFRIVLSAHRVVARRCRGRRGVTLEVVNHGGGQLLLGVGGEQMSGAG